MTECVECGAELSISESVDVAGIVDCTTCGTELEVVDVDPSIVELAPELEGERSE